MNFSGLLQQQSNGFSCTGGDDDDDFEKRDGGGGELGDICNSRMGEQDMGEEVIMDVDIGSQSVFRYSVIWIIEDCPRIVDRRRFQCFQC